MVASYERLADAAFAAAVDIQRHLNGKASDFDAYRALVKLLEQPVAPDESYKLLYDARNLPLYKAAWFNAFGANATEMKTDTFLQRVSEFLQVPLRNLDSGKGFRAPKEVARFCLALSQSFLQENAAQYNQHYQARMKNAAS
jgi:hypothetical protein